MPENTSLFDTPDGWRQAPLEAVSAWLLRDDFVVTKAGETQPLRASSAEVYGFMAKKFVREVVLPEPEEEGGRPGRAWADIESEHVASFLDEQALKKGIRGRYVRLLERMFDHLVALKVVAGNPARGLAIKAPTRSGQHNDRTMWLSAEQVERVIDGLRQLADEGSWKARRNRALIALVLGGGLRVSEVIVLRLPSIGAKQEDGTLIADLPPTGAGRHHRTRVAPWAAAIITEWLAERSELDLVGDLLFPAKTIGGVLHKATVYRHVASLLSDAGIDTSIIKRRGGRTLRNTFALNELEAGQPAELVGEYLGHRTDRSTRYYTALVKK